MSTVSKYTIRKLFAAAIWIIIGSGTIVLLIAAIEKRNNERCARIDIRITGVQNNFFIDKKEVMSILEKNKRG